MTFNPYGQNNFFKITILHNYFYCLIIIIFIVLLVRWIIQKKNFMILLKKLRIEYLWLCDIADQLKPISKEELDILKNKSENIDTIIEGLKAN